MSGISRLGNAGLRAALVVASASLSHPAEETRTLTLGERVEADLQPGAEQRYRVQVRAHRCAVVEITQTGIDVSLKLLASGSGSEEDLDRRTSGAELLFLVPDSDGGYELRVSPALPRSPPGRYTLVVRDLGGDDAVRAACRQEVDGRRLEAGGPEDREETIARFRAARASWMRLGQRFFAAHDAYEIARMTEETSDQIGASNSYRDAAREFGDLGMASDQAGALSAFVNVLILLGDYRSAVAEVRAGLPMESALTPIDRIEFRFRLAMSLQGIGDYRASLEGLQDVAARFHAVGMVSDELGALTQIATNHIARSDPVSALEVLTRGLTLSQQEKLPSIEGQFLSRIGIVYWEAGDAEAAAEHWRRALELYRSVEDHFQEGFVLITLGDYALAHGDDAEAEATFRQALEILRGVGSKEGEARVSWRLGRVLTKRGDYERAAEMQQQALEICRKHGIKRTEMLALWNLGRTKSLAGARAEGRKLLVDALELARTLGDGPNEFRILADLARVESDDRAMATLDEGIRRAEAEQRKALVPTLKAALGGDAQPLYAARTEILMRRHLANPRGGWDAEGLESAERARGRALLGLLAESRVDLRKGVDPALLESYRDLQRQLSEAAAAGSPDAGRIPQLTSALHTVEAKIRESSPAYAAVTQPTPLSVDSIQKRVLDEDTVLIEYALGESRSWVWGLSRDGLVAAALPPKDAIEAAAKRLYRSLSAPPSAISAAELDAAARELGRMLLAPIAAQLVGSWRGKRLAIVSEGALDYIPFAALPVPDPRASPSPAAPILIEDHESGCPRPRRSTSCVATSPGEGPRPDASPCWVIRSSLPRTHVFVARGEPRRRPSGRRKPRPARSWSQAASKGSLGFRSRGTRSTRSRGSSPVVTCSWPRTSRRDGRSRSTARWDDTASFTLRRTAC